MTYDRGYFRSARYAQVSFKKYRQYWWSNRFYALLARKHGPPSGRVLEVGCGMGHLLGWLSGPYEVHGLDVNEWVLGEARRNVPQGHFELMDAQNLSAFPNAHFQIIIAKHVVEHLPEPEKAIAEMGRVLAAEGLLLFGTPNLGSLMKARKKEAWIGFKDPTHISLRAPEEWLVLISAAGLRISKVFSDGFWDPPYIPLVPKFIQKLVYGAPGGIQAIFGWSFIPLRLGETMIVLAKKSGVQ